MSAPISPPPPLHALVHASSACERERLLTTTELRRVAVRYRKDVDGFALAAIQALQRHNWPERTAAPRLRPAHVALIYRDLKPSNILVARDPDGGGWKPYLMDFGIARRADARQTCTATSGREWSSCTITSSPAAATRSLGKQSGGHGGRDPQQPRGQPDQQRPPTQEPEGGAPTNDLQSLEDKLAAARLALAPMLGPKFFRGQYIGPPTPPTAARASDALVAAAERTISLLHAVERVKAQLGDNPESANRLDKSFAAHVAMEAGSDPADARFVFHVLDQEGLGSTLGDKSEKFGRGYSKAKAEAFDTGPVPTTVAGVFERLDARSRRSSRRTTLGPRGFCVPCASP